MTTSPSPVAKPRERYLRCEITTATANGTLEGVWALQNLAHNAPVTQDSSTVVATETHFSVAEGTA